MITESGLDDHVMAAATRSLLRITTIRVELMGQIDRWVAVHVPEPLPGAPVQAETLGQVVDRIARVWTQWNMVAQAAALLPHRQAREPRIAVLLGRLTELCAAYDALAVALLRGQRKLPQSPAMAEVLGW